MPISLSGLCPAFEKQMISSVLLAATSPARDVA